ncbi:hypothetical protein CF319_g7554 [Tilletia indica]|nr:hypothetical protein CF319_g7554 [Tilletia indica]KAE8227764.1 hypothetical protein CF326_g7327 [Tilletia indica]
MIRATLHAQQAYRAEVDTRIEAAVINLERRFAVEAASHAACSLTYNTKATVAERGQMIDRTTVLRREIRSSVEQIRADAKSFQQRSSQNMKHILTTAKAVHSIVIQDIYTGQDAWVNVHSQLMARPTTLPAAVPIQGQQASTPQQHQARHSVLPTQVPAECRRTAHVQEEEGSSKGTKRQRV